MHHFVTYTRETGEVTGYFIVSDPQYVPNALNPQEASVEVTDDHHLELLESVREGRTLAHGRVREGKIAELTAELPYRGKLVLTTDARDRDGDGIPELPADGKATARIQVAAQNPQGGTLVDPLVVSFRATRGALSHRNAKTRDGLAEVKLRTANETTICEVIASVSRFESKPLLLEFIPVEEYDQLERERPNRS